MSDWDRAASQVGEVELGIDTQEVIRRRDEVAGRNGRVFDVGAK